MRIAHCLPLVCGALLTLVSGARADQKAEALLKQVAAKTQATKTLTADLEMTMKRDQEPAVKSAGTVRLMKPNYARITTTGAPFALTIASDGKNLYVLDPQNQYQKREVDPRGKNINALWALPVTYFFNPGRDSFGPFGKEGAKTRYVGRQTVAGKAMDVVAISGTTPFPHTVTLFVGPDRLLHRSVVEMKQGTQTARFEATLRNVQSGKPLTTASFAYTPPKTARLYEPPDFEASLVAVGQKAPGFELPTPTGGKLALENTLKDKKAVLINFWFYN